MEETSEPRPCTFCLRLFVPRKRDKRVKFCSILCQGRQYRSQRAPALYGTIKDTGTIGAMAEMAVSLDLMARGYTVFRAISPSSYCDLIAVKDGNYLAIEVRTARAGADGKLWYAPNYRSGVNLFALWTREQGEITYQRIDRTLITL